MNRAGLTQAVARLSVPDGTQTRHRAVRQACREVGLSRQQRYAASKDLHAEKGSSGSQEHMSYGDLLAWCDNGSKLMATELALNASRTTILGALRGQILDAHTGYPRCSMSRSATTPRDCGNWRRKTQSSRQTPRTS